MSRRQRRDLSVFSLSVLDCICCGFGAVILLFVISKVSQPLILEQVQNDLSGLVAELEEQVHEIRGEVVVLNRELLGKREQISKTKVQIARLQGDLSDLEGRFAATSGDAEIENEAETRLAAAIQELTDEMRRLLASSPRRRDATVGGIPIDSEYIIFIIDTSGSMPRHAWPLVQRKMQ